MRPTGIDRFDPGRHLGMGMATVMRNPSAATRQAILRDGYEAGIRYIDVAPAYGYGAAESEVGVFTKSRPDVVVATKWGLRAPSHSRLLRHAQAPVRAVLQRSSALRSLVRGVEATHNAPAPVNVADLEASVARSLEHLGTEALDLLLLHDLPWSPALEAVLDRAGEDRRISSLGLSGEESVLATFPDPVIRTVDIVQSSVRPWCRDGDPRRRPDVGYSIIREHRVRAADVLRDPAVLEHLGRERDVYRPDGLDGALAIALALCGGLCTRALVGTSSPGRLGRLVSDLDHLVPLLSGDSERTGELCARVFA